MYLLLLLFIVIPFTQSPPTEHDLTSSNFMFSRTDAVSYGVNPRLIECTNAEREQVTESWKGARIFAAAHAKWRPAADYQETMTKYLGSQTSRSGRENMPVVQGEVEGPIWRRILQVAGVFTSTPGNPSPGHVRIYCDENVVFARDRPAQRCGPDGPVTYSWANEVSHLLGQAGRSRTEQYNHIVLCPSFFEDYLTLDQVESVADTSTTWSQYIDPWLSSRARSILHGVYHWSPYPIDPPCDMRPELNQPEEVIELATQKNTYGSPPDTKGAYHNGKAKAPITYSIRPLILRASGLLGTSCYCNIHPEEVSIWNRSWANARFPGATKRA